MANATVLRVGQINSANETDALFLKVFSGEVLTAFDKNCVFRDKQTVRVIQSGKSAQFPATWRVSASYHTPGAEIVGQTSNLNERIINVDDLLIASVFMSNFDEAMAHFDTRSEYARQCGLALGVQYDKNIAQTMVLAARASATVSGGSGGGSTTSTTTLNRTDASVLAASLFAAAQNFDEKDIPQGEQRWAFVRPAQYYLLTQSTTLINKDWGGSGAYSDGTITSIAGIPIVKTNHLPITDLSSAQVSAMKNTYNADFSKTAAVVATRSAVGTVQLIGMSTEAGYDMRRQGTLVLAKYALGHGILRPECAYEIKTTT